MNIEGRGVTIIQMGTIRCYLIQVLHIMDNLCGNGLKGQHNVSPGLPDSFIRQYLFFFIGNFVFKGVRVLKP